MSCFFGLWVWDEDHQQWYGIWITVFLGPMGPSEIIHQDGGAHGFFDGEAEPVEASRVVSQSTSFFKFMKWSMKWSMKWRMRGVCWKSRCQYLNMLLNLLDFQWPFIMLHVWDRWAFLASDSRIWQWPHVVESQVGRAMLCTIICVITQQRRLNEKQSVPRTHSLNSKYMYLYYYYYYILLYIVVCPLQVCRFSGPASGWEAVAGVNVGAQIVFFFLAGWQKGSIFILPRYGENGGLTTVNIWIICG